MTQTETYSACIGREIKFAQHGTGFVGEAVIRALHKVCPHLTLLGIDVDPEKVSKLRNRYHIPACLASEYTAYRDYNVHSFSIPTPCDTQRPDPVWGYNLEFLKKALADFGERVLRFRKDYTLIIIRSTVYPGTTEEVLIPLLESASGKTRGLGFDVVYNPEFLAQETAYRDACKPPLFAVASSGEAGFRVFEDCFAGFGVPCERCDGFKDAEWLKMANNVLNAIFISAANELRENMIRTGLSRERAQNIMFMLSCTAFAKKKKTYGLHDLGPWGGACLPKEVSAMLAGNGSRDLPSPVLAAAQEVNELMMALRESRVDSHVDALVRRM